MAVNSNNVYLFTSSTTFKVPAANYVQIECYAPSSGNTASINHGGSYSKIYNFDNTSGTTLTVTVGATGGNTWVSNTGSQPTSASQGCLAYGGAQTPTYQKANNIGDVKFAGGLGATSSSYYQAIGGQAGPNGPGGDVGQRYSTTGTYVTDLTLCGGGANGGSVGALGFAPYGRTGSGGTLGGGNGGYWNGSSRIQRTTDVVGQASYLNNVIQSSLVNYGPTGGGTFYQTNCGGCIVDNIDASAGFVVITLISPTKFILVTQTGQSSFTLPSDCTGISEIIAIGAGGNGATSNTTSCGGGGGGAYAGNTGGVTASAGTTVWCQVPAAGSGLPAYIKFGGATNIAPVTASQGVLANSGLNGSGRVGGAGGTTTGAIAYNNYSSAGGNGGNGSVTTTYRNHGGGGGAAWRAAAGGNGGDGYASSSAKGSGGGGSYTGAGNIGLVGAGGAGGGSGGAGAIGTSGTATSGSGGGGGGGFGTTNINGAVGSPINNITLFPIGTGSGGNAAAGTVYYGGGGGGGATTSNNTGGQGVLLIYYTTNAYAPPVSNGGFLQLA